MHGLQPLEKITLHNLYFRRIQLDMSLQFFSFTISILFYPMNQTCPYAPNLVAMVAKTRVANPFRGFSCVHGIPASRGGDLPTPMSIWLSSAGGKGSMAGCWWVALVRSYRRERWKGRYLPMCGGGESGPRIGRIWVEKFPSQKPPNELLKKSGCIFHMPREKVGMPGFSLRTKLALNVPNC